MYFNKKGVQYEANGVMSDHFKMLLEGVYPLPLTTVHLDQHIL